MVPNGERRVKKKSWVSKTPKPTRPKPVIADELRQQIDLAATKVVAQLKRRCKKPKSSTFNWPEDVFVHWHREALYFIVVMRTPHDRPPTFEVHIGRLEHVGNGRFNFAVPMGRGWITLIRDESAENCLTQS